jgi:hypothetical protein
MSDLANLSDDQLAALYRQTQSSAPAQAASPDLSSVSNDQLLQLYAASQQQPAPTNSLRPQPRVVSSQGPDPYRPKVQYDPTEGMSTPGLILTGAGRAAANVIRHGANLLSIDHVPGIGDTSAQGLEDAQQIDEPLRQHDAARWGDVLGEAATMALPATGATRALGTAGRIGAAVAENPISRGMLEGGLQGAVMANPGERAEGALMGGVVGGALPGAYGAYKGVMRGVNPTDSARALLAEGVNLTPGQMNPRGMFGQLEQSWQNMPLIGPQIQSARDAAQSQWQRSIIDRSMAPGARLSGQSGDLNALTDEAFQSYAPAYDAAKGFTVKPAIQLSQGPTVPLKKAFAGAASDQGVRADNATRSGVNAWLQNALTQLPKTGVKSEHLLQLRSDIRSQAREAVLAQDRPAAALLKNAEAAVTTSLDRQLPPDVMAQVRAADLQYSNYKTVEAAVRKGGDRPGGFTPSQLTTAIRESTDRGAFARGGGNLRDLSSAGADVFETVVPPTGARIPGIAVPMAAAYHSPLIAIPAAIGAMGMYGTQAGRKIAAGQTGAQLLGQALDRQIKQNTSPLLRETAAQMARRLSVAAALEDQRQ